MSAFGDERQLAVASLVFLVVFYCPGDICFSLVTVPPVFAMVCAAKEVLRGLKVTNGVNEGLAFDAESVLVPILVGTIKGNGSGFMTPFVRAIRGAATSNNEISSPSVTTKACLMLASLLLFVDSAYGDFIYMTAIGFFIAIKLAVIFVDPVDPFTPLENILVAFLKGISNTEITHDKTE